MAIVGEPKSIPERGEVQAGKARRHPGAKVAHLEIGVVGLFDFADAVGEALEEAVVVEDEDAIEGAPNVYLDVIASEERGLIEGFQGVFGQVRVRRAMAIEIDTAGLLCPAARGGEEKQTDQNEAKMSRDACMSLLVFVRERVHEHRVCGDEDEELFVICHCVVSIAKRSGRFSLKGLDCRAVHDCSDRCCYEETGQNAILADARPRIL